MGGVVWSQNKKREKQGPLSFKIVVKASKWQNSCNSSIVHDKKALQIILSTLLQFNFTWKQRPKFSSFHLILQHWSAMYLLHSPMESFCKYYKKRAITDSSKYTIQHNWTKMTTIQLVPHAFSSASKVTVSPFQQSPNKYFFVSKMR